MPVGLLLCWTDDIIEWTGLAIIEAAGSTQDRDRWRGILRAANYPSSEGRHWTTNDDCYFVIGDTLFVHGESNVW